MVFAGGEVGGQLQIPWKSILHFCLNEGEKVEKIVEKGGGDMVEVVFLVDLDHDDFGVFMANFVEYFGFGQI